MTKKHQIISKKAVLGVATLLLLVWAITAQGAPPIPARIGGTVSVDGTQLTQATDAGYTFVVTKQDGTAYKPEAKDSDGFNASDWYVINVPVYDAAGQPDGAKTGEIAVIQVFKDGSEMRVISPSNGRFAVGKGGSATRIDIVVKTGKKGKP